MPCDSVTTISIDFSKADALVIHEALKMMGFTVSTAAGVISAAHPNGTSVMWREGRDMKLTGRYQSFTEDDVRVAYANAAVLVTAKRAGWQAQTINKGEYRLVRR